METLQLNESEQTLAAENGIKAVKALRERTNCSLRDGATVVSAWRNANPDRVIMATAIQNAYNIGELETRVSYLTGQLETAKRILAEARQLNSVALPIGPAA